MLTFKLEGEISDKLQGRFSPGFSMPQILDSLEKAAVDPRIKGIAVEISPLAVRVRGVCMRFVFVCLCVCVLSMWCECGRCFALQERRPRPCVCLKQQMLLLRVLWPQAGLGLAIADVALSLLCVRPPTSACGRQIGWSKVQELRRYIKMFRDSGKYTVCYMKVRPLLPLLQQCSDGLSHAALHALVLRYVRTVHCIQAVSGHAARPAGSS